MPGHRISVCHLIELGDCAYGIDTLGMTVSQKEAFGDIRQLPFQSDDTNASNGFGLLCSRKVFGRISMLGLNISN